MGCHGHGSPLPLIPAIATSCNAYFCWGLYRMFGDKKYGSPQNALTVCFNAVCRNYYVHILVLLGVPCFKGKAKLENADVRAVACYDKCIGLWSKK